MNTAHRALIVEDSGSTAEDLVEILTSIGCESTCVDNKRGALELLRSNNFCVILLDLEIRGDHDSIKGHIEHGNSLLREIRLVHADHIGTSYGLPILIVSGFAREVSAAVGAMQDGADDVIQKPFNTRLVSDAIRRALERSGRVTHDLCTEKPAAMVTDDGKSIVLGIPGDRVGRRTRVMVGSTPITLTDSSLKVLLRLMIAFEEGRPVHKRDLGARDDKGYKGVSVLREALKSALPTGVSIVRNEYHGNYCLTDRVTISSCNIDKLAQLEDRKITELAQRLSRLLGARQKESDGNS